MTSNIQPLTPLGHKGLINTDLNVSLYFLAVTGFLGLEILSVITPEIS